MEELIRFLVLHEKRTTASIYLSILIAYLEQIKWYEAQRIMCILEKMQLTQNESMALAYLSILLEWQDIKKIVSLTICLCDG